MKNIAVLVRGGGTNLQAIIDAENKGTLISGKIKLVISNKANAYALERAKSNKIKTIELLKLPNETTKDYDSRLDNLLKENQQDVIITDAKIEEIKQLPIDKEDTNNVISPESKEDEKNKLSIGNNIDENTKIINIEENAELFIENREDEYHNLLVEDKIESNTKDL